MTDQTQTANRLPEPRRDYDTPRLEHFGDLRALTQSNGTGIEDQDLGSCRPT